LAEIEGDEHKTRFVRVMGHREAEFAAHLEHRHVPLQHDPFNAADLLGTRIGEDLPQQLPADAVALQVGAHEQRIFAFGAVGVA
jgi:hypothetical protein